MTRREALEILTAHREELSAVGLRRLALFASVAHDEAGPDSDVDVLVEFSGEPTFKQSARLYDRLEALFPCSVDMVTETSLRAPLKIAIETDGHECFLELPRG